VDATGLIIREEGLADIERALDEMLRGSKAACVLLINPHDGSLIAARGPTEALDTTSLAALAAGTFASATEIARLVGEPEFTVLFHQGKQSHVHVSVAGQHALLMTLFGDETTVGLVRLCAKKTCLSIQTALSATA
jgi:predicted regulator of Ras-like GTPase activity (Roadblock/LC7/MglB family)